MKSNRKTKKASVKPSRDASSALSTKETGRITGEKFDFLEKSRTVSNICKSIFAGHLAEFNDEEVLGFEQIVKALMRKNEDSQCEISKAANSAIFVSNVQSELKIHAGANIDPDHIHLFQSPEHRNCAEKQAALSAVHEDDLSNEELDLIFLYRRPDEAREFQPEMLVPCSDCHDNYVEDLIDNNGKLVVILPHDQHDSFLKDGSPIEENSIYPFRAHHGEFDFYYKIIDEEELKHIKVEEKLGSKVKSKPKNN